MALSDSEDHPGGDRRRSPGRRAGDQQRDLAFNALLEQHETRKELGSWLRKLAIVALVLWALVATVATVTLAVQQGRNSAAVDRANKAAKTAGDAAQAAGLALANSVQAGGLAQAIQDQRVASIRDACNAQNMRHDQTIKILDQLIAQAPRGRKQQQVRAQRASTILFINALAPHQDCARVVALATTNHK